MLPVVHPAIKLLALDNTDQACSSDEVPLSASLLNRQNVVLANRSTIAIVENRRGVRHVCQLLSGIVIEQPHFKNISAHVSTSQADGVFATDALNLRLIKRIGGRLL